MSFDPCEFDGGIHGYGESALSESVKKRSMTKDEMRIAISEKSGWQKNHNTNRLGIWSDHNGKSHQNIPDYPNDLNAMNEAENYAFEHLMNSDQWEQYGRLLLLAHPHATVVDDGKIDYWDLACVCNLSAEVRAEAFCRVFWPERFEK